MMKLYVGNLSFSTTDSDLSNLFAQVGTVESARVVTDRDTGQSRGFGFVEMADRTAGEAAISQLNGREFNGRTIKVNEAKPQESRSSDRGGYRSDNRNKSRFSNRY
jgi:cold-inducible RNA-binding protein